MTSLSRSDQPPPAPPAEMNPDELSRLLEIELMQKRAAWQQASSRHKMFKSASMLFLFVIIMLALVGFYLVFARFNGARDRVPQPPSAADSSAGP